MLIAKQAEIEFNEGGFFPLATDCCIAKEFFRLWDAPIRCRIPTHQYR
jgi:hypothetical protein